MCSELSGNIPKVSIILPTHNGSKYVRKSIESCLNQTYKNIELIIVDDGSTDETAQILKSYEDARIKRIRHKKNFGLPTALNTGFANSTGNYLTWTSDDNMYLPSAIEEMLLYLQKNSGLDLVYADCWIHDLDSNQKYLRIWPDVMDLAKENSMSACFLYTRRVYDKIGFYNQKFRFVEDYDYWIRIFKNFKGGHYAKPLYIYGTHSKALSKTKLYTILLLTEILRYKSGFITLSEFGNSFYLPDLTRKFASFFLSYIKVSSFSLEFCLLSMVALLRSFAAVVPKYSKDFFARTT